MGVTDSLTRVNLYRYGFNGKEKDDEVKGSGNSLDFGARIHDPRVGRFLSIDPRSASFPWQSPFSYAANNPVRYKDNNGENPIDPRTGKEVPQFDFYSSSIVDYSSYFETHDLKVVADKNLLEDVSRNFLWLSSLPMPRKRGSQNFLGDNTNFNPLDRTMEQISKRSQGLLSEAIPNRTGGRVSYPAPSDHIWKKAAELGTYSYIENTYTESNFLQLNEVNNTNVVQVVEGYITSIVNLSRDNYEDKLEVSSITNFAIDKGSVQSRMIDGESQNYRTLSVTETTTNYDKAGNVTGSSSKLYTREEIVE